ncbi:hypothetical protein [Parapedobacter sp. DT-150]|uniref:hypothetical protein n=1 Tax=Parapedobacter sp. DT-150 TaxID=3396162 RepID=UPI003F1D6996
MAGMFFKRYSSTIFKKKQKKLAKTIFVCNLVATNQINIFTIAQAIGYCRKDE